MPLPPAATKSKRGLLAAGGLAAASFVAFVIGLLSLGIGIAIPSSSHRADTRASGVDDGKGQDEPEKPKERGLFAKLGGIVSNVLPSGGGPDKPGYNNGHPVGLYLMTRYWMTTHSLEKAVWYFTSDGRVFVNLEDGFSDDILAAQKGQHGTASADGANMTVTWSDGTKASSPVEKESGGFNWDMGIFVPVERFAGDGALAGRWEGGTSVTFGGSHAATSNTLELRPDGKFVSESIATLRSQSDGSVASTGSEGANAGTWHLDGYTLTLTYGNGKVLRGITFPFNDGKTERFYFAGTMYKKER